mmetsp:Transcript_934/g.3932  ORF Transcript_934/g.3932 Transcript_934/m.3932 type:complete len:227 (+) Transcript_934:844-1524(+)
MLPGSAQASSRDLRRASSSLSMASLTGRPSGRAPLELAPGRDFFKAASSSSTPPASKALNWASRLSGAANTPMASASASMPSTFSSMRSNAPSADDVDIPLTISLTALFVFALAARAFNVSFLLFASAILPSSKRVFAINLSTASLCASRFAFIDSAFSAYDFRLVSASLARSSSPFSIANCARLYQSSAAFVAALYFVSSCFCDAITCAVACRILIKSPCISFTV